MIKINCQTKDTLKIIDMVAFQGNLKKRTQKDIDELKESLLSEGLMMPFAIWKKPLEQTEESDIIEHLMYLLDGHGRREAIIQLATTDPNYLNVDWPVVFIDAETEDDARKALLQITSSYGKITKQGVKQFCVSIPDYKAPAIAKYVAKPVSKKVTLDPEAKPVPKKTIIKIRVDSDKVEEIKNTLRQVSKLIEVL